MTSYVRHSFASLSTTCCAFIALLALVACGGDDGGVIVADAAEDAAIDAPTDAAPLVCNAPTMNCSGTCVNTTNSVNACGNCTNACSAGQLCMASACACPTLSIPTAFTGGIGIALQGQQLNTNTLSGNALVIGINPTMTNINQPYTLNTTLSDLPQVGFAINLNVDISNPANTTVDATYAATEGMVNITKVCPDGPGMFPDGGVMGTLTNVKFSAVDGLLSGTPTIVEGGCTIPATGTIASISFELGNVACSSSAQ